MKSLRIIALLALSLLTNTAFAQDLLSATQQDQAKQQQHDKQREAGFYASEKELQQLRDKLLAQRDRLQKSTDQLAQTFSDNEERLATLEDKLRLETGSLGEVFGVVRQNAKALQTELDQSLTSVDRHLNYTAIDQIVQAKTLPSIDQLRGLWQGFHEQIQASSEVEFVSVDFVDGEGTTAPVIAARIGSFALLTEHGYSAWNGKTKLASAYPRQPEHGANLASVKAASEGQTVNLLLDPSRGAILEQLAQTPTLIDRLQAGGVVGKIILALLALGLIIALVRGARLLAVKGQINKQLKQPEIPGNNPLGRVLAVHQKHTTRSAEALELRLLEAVVDEQAGLEKGLSMLKLLAALAPMLGLLGTVTGMIETFQVITQFGNSDPKVMAGGISMALVTTVLGLVAAMPLLLAHNVLSSQAEYIRTILEKQGLGLVAAQAEQQDHYQGQPVAGRAVA